MLPIQAMHGIRVLDLTRLLPGPLATQWMAQMGAEVVKIEEPGKGDYMRSMKPEGLFEQVNAGKKSVVLDLKSPAGQQQFHRLAATADVLIEGFRPGVMDRLNCGWSALQIVNPSLIYVALTGYGSDGPYRDIAGHDVNYLAMAGVLDLMGDAGGAPSIPGVQIADIAGGSMQALTGTLAALLERQRTGRGQFVDVSMTHGSAKLLQVAMAQLRIGTPLVRGEHVLSGHYACYRVYQTADDRYVAVGALEAKFWKNLCGMLGCAEYAEHQFAEDPLRTQIIARLQAAFREHSAEEWWSLMKDRDVSVTPVRTLAEALGDFGEPGQGPVPALGEHTADFVGE
ncbi:MAG: CoA transferase [Bryobacterales bacterium]|nr:CoA transferase [Bryobacterales bacterium]